MTQPRDFGFGEEQAMLQEAARRFCEDKQPLTSLRQAAEGTEDPYHGADRPGFCDTVTWQEMVELGWTSFAGLDATEEEIDRYAEEGYLHGVLTPWSPETGSLESWESLFVARPEQWSPDDGEAGSSSEAELSGQYVLSSRFLWDLGVDE